MSARPSIPVCEMPGCGKPAAVVMRAPAEVPGKEHRLCPPPDRREACRPRTSPWHSQEASHESQIAANTAGGGDCHRFHDGMQEEKRRRPSHGEGVHGCRYDDEEIEPTCSGVNPRPRTVLDVLRTTA